jgi:hypothetical protein
MARQLEVVLFAPAHRGASVVDLALEFTTGMAFIKYFVGIAQFQSPLVNQLKSGSDELCELLADTKKARRNGANPHLRAQQVVFAEYEKIVKNLRFADDPPQTRFQVRVTRPYASRVKISSVRSK